MNKSEIISMLQLLEDPDEKVFELIRNKILDNSDTYRTYLENFHAISSNDMAIQRSELLLDEMFLEDFEKRLSSIVVSKDANLLEGTLLIEEYFNRDLDVDALKNEADKIIKSIWIEMNDQLTGIEKVKLISTAVFEKMKFQKYPVAAFKPAHMSLFNCLTYKKYVAPNIALLYCIIAQEMDVPLYPVALPGLFILSYVDTELADAVFLEKNNGSVFYIHPFDKGEFINHQIVEKYLEEKKVEKRLQDFGNMKYMEYLSFYFEMRILALKHKKIQGFELQYASRVKEIFKGI